ncbi:endonuclease/exonuclease/phosphatase family protein [Streptomyces acidiscabies]|uniref:Endonuclease/exonuclease/phosphatase family protein n=1 Tax=Streptomyces acidiscabies TaxID=42234 RepID=A0AAP6BJU1_9ACTN|nr:endonuclease/exonuclease/phosphatase family protein [Streptomyces acidiscabies]MBP5936753.1 endonuclease/exonuclease/phosphatase family protein [Streptomyces sp. LBUM 1476]MBZ3915240.1 endonuclease/exonuclease/phosphatase family protein [Streptomyces acidiscabies]MDX2966069.1 endonuclease/exonuclease/phosphatase family protein [Streptomyces acidiscabies]MDX3021302.1 endonuclease/exonuclease/phosphatase family protein [Streptomyces acidiscabies]MDX3793445.1 endonuclease/exonuclease/phosphata
MSNTYSEPVIKVVTFNLEHDGGPDEDGRFPKRWHDAHHFLSELEPDLLFRQEMTYSRDKKTGNRRLHAAETYLGMRGFIGAEGVGNNPTALFSRPGTFNILRQFDHPGIWRTPPAQAVVCLRELPERPIVVVSWHGAFNSVKGREREADEITNLADKMKQGFGFIGGGDCNEYPVPHGEKVPPIDWSSPDITDRVHMVHRSKPNPDGTRTSCTYLDGTLLACGLHDPARYAAHHLGKPHALNPTAGHAPQSRGQGGPRRIDRHYTDPWTATAAVDVIIHDTSDFSDHNAVEVVYSRAKFIEAQKRAVTPLPPYDFKPLGKAA